VCCWRRCSDKEAQCELIDQMMQEIIREEFEQEDATALGACLCQTLHSQFEPSILPQELDEELVHVFLPQVVQQFGVMFKMMLLSECEVFLSVVM